MDSPDEDETVNDDVRTGMPSASSVEDIIGNYRSFFADLRKRLKGVGIDIAGRALSHLAFRTASVPEYESVRERLRTFCVADVENVWNGRPIAKLLLRKPLSLDRDVGVSLIELIPTPHQRNYPMGLEHLGVVIGETFEEFLKGHKAVLTGRQDQGPFCQPAYITFENNRTVKFYRYSLKDVVEKEDRSFTRYA
jgi:predicted metalloenzyme YecM